jgi:hypothetical protein
MTMTGISRPSSRSNDRRGFPPSRDTIRLVHLGNRVVVSRCGRLTVPFATLASGVAFVDVANRIFAVVRCCRLLRSCPPSRLLRFRATTFGRCDLSRDPAIFLSHLPPSRTRPVHSSDSLPFERCAPRRTVRSQTPAARRTCRLKLFRRRRCSRAVPRRHSRIAVVGIGCHRYELRMPWMSMPSPEPSLEGACDGSAAR